MSRFAQLLGMTSFGCIIRRMKVCTVLMMVLVWPFTATAQCGFVVEPAATTRWYLSEGWQLPGVTGAKIKGPLKVSINGKAPAWPEGVTLSEVHPNQAFATFPEVQFNDNDKPKIMRTARFDIVQLWRWEIHAKPYAYSYALARPGIGCEFSIDLLDDRGDGIFRTMILPGHTLLTRELQPPPVPDWVKPKS